MRLLLDTHALLWWWTASPRLSPRIWEILAKRADESFVSVASIWEMAIKVKADKLPTAKSLLQRLEDLLAEDEILPLAINHTHARRAGGLDRHHGDPFDRMLVAQAELESLALVSADKVFDLYGVERIW